MTCRSASHYPFLDMLRLPFEEMGPMYEDPNMKFGDWDLPEDNAAARERAQATINQSGNHHQPKGSSSP